MNPSEQKHPLEARDRLLIDTLLKAKVPNDQSLAELARLKIRYRGFPGAREIQRDLELVLEKWGLTEAELYQKTRAIHAIGKVYRQATPEEAEDWS